MKKTFLFLLSPWAVLGSPSACTAPCTAPQQEPPARATSPQQTLATTSYEKVLLVPLSPSFSVCVCVSVSHSPPSIHSLHLHPLPSLLLSFAPSHKQAQGRARTALVFLLPLLLLLPLPAYIKGVCTIIGGWAKLRIHSLAGNSGGVLAGALTPG